MTFPYTNSFIQKLRQNPIDPVRDWLALITISLFILVGIIMWNMWTFDTVANGGVIGTSPASSRPTFSQTSLNTIRAIFSSRAEEEAKYETGTYRFADPSQ